MSEYLHLLRCVCGMMPSTFHSTIVQQALNELAGGIEGRRAAVLRLYLLYFFFRQRERVGKGWGAYGGPTFALPGVTRGRRHWFCVVRP